MTLCAVRSGLRALLLGCVIAGSAPATVSAESGISPEQLVFAKLRRPTLPIPTDGALLLVSGDFTLPIVEVRDPDGALIEGRLLEVGLDTGPLYSWKSTALLTTGTYEVTIRHPDGGDREDLVSVEVVEPFASELPALNTEPSAIWQAFPQNRTCCYVPGIARDTVCFATLQEAVIRVQPGFSSASSQAILNQWLFRVGPAPGSSGGDANPIYRPLEHPAHEVMFREAADAYCIDVHARNIATLEESVYSSLESCASHDNRELGPDIPIEVDPSVLTIKNGCLAPPDAYKDPWCEANAGICDTGNISECQLFEYVCEGGPLPEVLQNELARDGGFDLDGGLPGTLDGSTAEPRDAASDAAEMPPDPIDASFGPSADQGGCAITSPRARSSASASLGAALILLMLALRRNRLTRCR